MVTGLASTISGLLVEIWRISAGIVDHHALADGHPQILGALRQARSCRQRQQRRCDQIKRSGRRALSNTRMGVIVVSLDSWCGTLVASRDHFHGLLVPRITTIWSGGGGGGGATGATAGGAATHHRPAARALLDRSRGLAEPRCRTARRRSVPESSRRLRRSNCAAPAGCGLRRWPASASRPRSGVTSKVTVATGTGVPRASACMVCPAERTSMFCRHGGGHVAVAAGRTAGDQHVHAHAGQHESGHAGDVVDAHRDRAHAHRNGGRQTQPAALDRQAAFEHRLIQQDVGDHRAVQNFLHLRERALGERLRRKP